MAKVIIEREYLSDLQQAVNDWLERECKSGYTRNLAVSIEITESY